MNKKNLLLSIAWIKIRDRKKQHLAFFIFHKRYLRNICLPTRHTISISILIYT